MKREYFGIVLLLLATALFNPKDLRAQNAAPTEIAVTISKVPVIINKPGIYILRKDLVMNSGSSVAIMVNATDVTIDLGGHVLSTDYPQDNTNSSVGIYAGFGLTTFNLNVRNGTLRNFATGISLNQPSAPGNSLFENINFENIGVTGLGGDATQGIVEVRHCHFLNMGYNTAQGQIYAINVGGRNCNITNNTVYNVQHQGGQGATGIHVYGSNGAFAIDNQITNPSPLSGAGAVGIQFSGSTNWATGNYIGFFNSAINMGGGGKYRDNHSIGCTTVVTGGTSVGTND